MNCMCTRVAHYNILLRGLVVFLFFLFVHFYFLYFVFFSVSISLFLLYPILRVELLTGQRTRSRKIMGKYIHLLVQNATTRGPVHAVHFATVTFVSSALKQCNSTQCFSTFFSPCGVCLKF